MAPVEILSAALQSLLSRLPWIFKSSSEIWQSINRENKISNILYSDNQLSACIGALFLLKTKIQKVVQSVILIPFHIFSGTCWDGGGVGNLIQNSYEGGVVVMFIHGGILFPHLFQHICFSSGIEFGRSHYIKLFQSTCLRCVLSFSVKGSRWEIV